MKDIKYSGYWGNLGYYQKKSNGVYFNHRPVNVKFMIDNGEYESCIQWVIQTLKELFYKELLK